MSRRSLRQILAGFHRDQSAAAAIEFALLAPLVLAIVFSTVESGWIMAQSIMLDKAVNTTTRTMQIGDRTTTYANFRKAVCEAAVILRDCEKTLTLELTPINSAADFPKTAATCVNRAVKVEPITAFNPGKGSQIIYGRACFVVDPLTPALGYALRLPKDETGGVRLTARFAFVNEPS